MASLLDLQCEDPNAPILASSYTFVNNLRLVRPYYFDFKCNVKQRWQGQLLVDVFCNEFSGLTREYYERAFAAGKLRIEGQPQWQLHFPLRDNLCIRHFLHRHEPPVLKGDVQIVAITPEYVAVSKPACMPVHATGQYRKNTLMGVLQSQRPDLGPLFPAHRLDKPVSGLMVLARQGAAATKLRLAIEQNACEKIYIARVCGVFPETPEPMVVDAALSWESANNHVTAIGPDHPNPAAFPEPKPSETHFTRLSVAPDGLTSLVECRPKTGRTHQIRVHLQYVGHPIANDTQYGGTYGFPRFFTMRPIPPPRPLTPLQEKHRDRAKAKRQKGCAEDIQPAVPSAPSSQLPASASACTAPTSAAADTLPPPVSTLVEDVAAAVHAQRSPPTAIASDEIVAADTPMISSPAVDADAAEDTALRIEQSLPDAEVLTGHAVRSDQQAQLAQQQPLPEQHPQSPHLHHLDGDARRQQKLASQVQAHSCALPVVPGATCVASSSATSAPDQPCNGTATVGTATLNTSTASVAQPVDASTAAPGLGAACIDAATDAAASRASRSVAAVADVYQRLYSSDIYRVEESCIDPLCPHCPCLVPEGYPIDLQPLWLHARCYSNGEWRFEADVPDWGHHQYVAKHAVDCQPV